MSADHSSTIICWSLETGQLSAQLVHAHGDALITALAVDASKRRLISGAHDGTLKMWNVSSGECLKECLNPDATEVTDIAHVASAGGGRFVLATGWGRALSVWADDEGQARQGNSCVEIMKRVQEHHDDVLALAYCAPGTPATSSHASTHTLCSHPACSHRLLTPVCSHLVQARWRRRATTAW